MEPGNALPWIAQTRARSFSPLWPIAGSDQLQLFGQDLPYRQLSKCRAQVGIAPSSVPIWKRRWRRERREPLLAPITMPSALLALLRVLGLLAYPNVVVPSIWYTHRPVIVPRRLSVSHICRRKLSLVCSRSLTFELSSCTFFSAVLAPLGSFPPNLAFYTYM